jgi:spore coat polysaccharide biosynthesis protein SpsF
MIHKSIVGIQARSGSTRLPRKVLADLAGESLIMRVVERARRCALVDAVVVLTSTEPSDDELALHLESEGVMVRRGPLQDVMARYLALVDEFAPQYLVRVTGDCPLLEPDFIDLQLGALSALDADFVKLQGNDGGDFEGTLGGQMALSVRALRAAANSKDARDREHVGSFYFTTRRDQFRFVEVEMGASFCCPGLRLAVDESEDLELVQRIFAHFGNTEFSTEDALTWLAGENAIRALNAGVQESQDNQDRQSLALNNPIQAVAQWP